LIGRESFDARVYADQTLALLRLAQKTAIAQNRPVFVRLNGTSIALCFNDIDCATRVLAPGGNGASTETLAACSGDKTWYCEAPPDGASLSLSPALPSFYFSALGKPYAATDADPTGASTFARLALQIRRGAEEQTLYVEEDTGYVHQ
jgi:MSHA pilin protein MshC